jgi:uncharacterized membrane protein
MMQEPSSQYLNKPPRVLTGHKGYDHCRSFSLKITFFKHIFVLNTLMNSNALNHAPMPAVTEPTNYTRLSKKIIHRADDLANLSPYNPVVREITTDFKPTYIPAKIVISSAVTITS